MKTKIRTLAILFTILTLTLSTSCLDLSKLIGSIPDPNEGGGGGTTPIEEVILDIYYGLSGTIDRDNTPAAWRVTSGPTPDYYLWRIDEGEWKREDDNNALIQHLKNGTRVFQLQALIGDRVVGKARKSFFVEVFRVIWNSPTYGTSARKGQPLYVDVEAWLGDTKLSNFPVATLIAPNGDTYSLSDGSQPFPRNCQMPSNVPSGSGWKIKVTYGVRGSSYSPPFNL